MNETQQLFSQLRHEFPGLQARYESKSPGAELEASGFANFVIDLYEQRNEQQLRTAFDRMERLYSGAGREIRQLIVFEFLASLQELAACKPYGPEALVQYLGPETRRIWAELDEISRTCSRLDMRERPVLESEILTWWLLREALQREGAAAK
jgi:hypothetical protein